MVPADGATCARRFKHPRVPVTVRVTGRWLLTTLDPKYCGLSQQFKALRYFGRHPFLSPVVDFFVRGPPGERDPEEGQEDQLRYAGLYKLSVYLSGRRRRDVRRYDRQSPSRISHASRSHKFPCARFSRHVRTGRRLTPESLFLFFFRLPRGQTHIRRNRRPITSPAKTLLRLASQSENFSPERKRSNILDTRTPVKRRTFLIRGPIQRRDHISFATLDSSGTYINNI